MSVLRYLRKAQPLKLHALEPGETWFQRAYWLCLLVRELKQQIAALRAQNEELLNQVNAGLPLTTDQEEFLQMRHELNELHKAKARVDKRVNRYFQVNKGLIHEIEDLRSGKAA